MYTQYDWRFAIALALADLDGSRMINRGIRPPSLALYDDHARRVGRAAGGQSLRGFSWVELFWASIDSRELFRLNRIVDDALAQASGFVYLTTDISSNGTGVGGTFVNLHGVPLRPETQPQGRSESKVYQGVTFRVENVEIDP